MAVLVVVLMHSLFDCVDELLPGRHLGAEHDYLTGLLGPAHGALLFLQLGRYLAECAAINVLALVSSEVAGAVDSHRLPQALNAPVALRLASDAGAVVNPQPSAEPVNRAIHLLGGFTGTVVAVEDGGHAPLAYCMPQGIAHRADVLRQVD